MNNVSKNQNAVEMPAMRLNRRGFLTAAAVGGSLLLASRAAEAQTATGVRKSAKDLTEAEWQALERGVAAMKRIDRSSPVSWSFQANMHGFPDDEPQPRFQGWGTCQHGNWWFLPWHRAYLLYFEKIVRAYSGDPGFMLPYWDWTDPEQQALPERFLNPSSPLYEANRNPQINGGGPLYSGAVNWSQVARQTIFSTPFKGRGLGGQREPAPGDMGSHGAMEANCHDLVHDSIGGLMGDPATAARDPIFWLHHANVDRLWGAWLQARGRSFLPSEPLWLNTPFLYYGPRGGGSYMTAAQVLNSPDLGYRYDAYPRVPTIALAGAPFPQTGGTPPVVQAPPQLKQTPIATATPPRAELTSEPLSVTFTPDANGKGQIEGVLRPPIMAPAPGGPPQGPAAESALQVVVEDIRFDRSPGRFYEVYINLPQPTDATGPTSDYYAGSISFFALATQHGHAMAGAPATRSAVIDITEAAARLRASGRLNDDIKVTLVERSAKPKPGVVGAPMAAPAPRVTIGSVRLQRSGE